TSVIVKSSCLDSASRQLGARADHAKCGDRNAPPAAALLRQLDAPNGAGAERLDRLLPASIRGLRAGYCWNAFPSAPSLAACASVTLACSVAASRSAAASSLNPATLKRSRCCT